jgi:hypothetical protein
MRAFLIACGCLAGFACAALAGCNGGPRYVPVSGTVKLDGKPYGEAVVVFSPMATSDNPNPGRGSSAFTDASGRFELQTDEGHKGAVVGKHRVRIMTKGEQTTIDYATETSPDDLPAGTKPRVDPIPRSWNVDSDKEFEVPPEGTDQADFDISTKR